MKKKICLFIFILALFSFPLSAQQENTAPCWRWEQMKPGDLEQAIKTLPVAYMVVSPLEWHGEALPFGTDPYIGAAIAARAWRKTGGVLLPTLYLGNETLYKDWTSKGLTDYWGLEWITKEHNPGSLYLSTLTFELVIREMLACVEKQGFKACVIVSGHAGVEYVRVLQEFEKRSQQGPMLVIYKRLVEKKAPAEIDFPGDTGHADFAEASILGAIDSTMVDKTLFGKSSRDRKIGVDEKNVGKIDFEKGRDYLNLEAEKIIETVQEFLKDAELKK